MRRAMRFASPISLLLATAVAGGCAATTPSQAPSSPNQLQSDGKADGSSPLWAGLVSATFERYTQDPCDNGANAVGDAPIVYDEWARERAGVRNICFEVWSPGVTDTDNADYWKLLDVQVHYRFGTGAWQTAYVPSIDRRGHNRRYAWSLDASLDPMLNGGSVVAVGAPLTIVSESSGWAEVQKDLQFYFTVNGEKLMTPSAQTFTLRYEGEAQEPTLAAKDGGYVLGDTTICQAGALHIGWGAGYFAVDVHDQAAVAALGGGAGNGQIYGVPVALSGAPGAQILSTIFSSSEDVPGQTMPAYRDPNGARVEPDGTSVHVAFDVYDRASNTVQTRAWTFTDCAPAPATH
jgi:hypothetical protein